MPATVQLLVARIGKPHGLRGEVTVQAHTDDPERRFVAGRRLRTEAAPGPASRASLTLSTRPPAPDGLAAGFDEVPDRTGAEGLRGTRLFVAAGESPTSGRRRGPWYEDELVGLAASTRPGTAR